MKKIISLIMLNCVIHTATAQLYVSPGTTLYLAGDAKITLQNTDLVNEGTISAPSIGRFIFNGTGNNQISGTSVPTFAELEIAKTGTGLLTLDNDIYVSGKIIFTSNLIELDNHNIDLGTTGFLEGENENSRITGTSGGTVFLTTSLNAPTSANPGNLGAVITSSQNLGSTVIRRGHQSQVNSSGTGNSIYRYYDITPTNNTGLNATLRINYFDAEKNSLDENAFELFSSSDNVNWTNRGQSARDAVSNYTEQTGLNNFSRWTLSTNAAVLPVTGLHLTGRWKNDAAWLEWMTQTEYNNSHFNIERKYDDELNFYIVGRKNTTHPGGNSTTPTTYHWTDHALSNKSPIQYRIQQQSLDGATAYSNIISIRPDASSLFIQKIYPTIGVKGSVYIATGGMQINKMQVQVFDISGRLMLNKEMNYQSGWMSLPQLAAGTYKVFVRSGEYKWEGSFVKD
ncbi:MAG: hypothetical protein H3C36_08010 [Chitinophagaceae bacterium]|nr:hypothetical protein [Chitinophagaceae bacterium]MCW5915058.1 hypothetical protein [Chitinophagaceae bacterium]MCZ2396671.1 hypothetical protein [Chitinophagales bacterium]